eukprot:CAMPEP_0167802240 /NCGR_PEP_ID=MMETSP0111_2-20121227/18997_1 /TAXON_ID=91324 /ORGANISM="Lotharella globosa, Strain CCCM811" /LENGTH=251 /DNA_ID=CAMNT_0007698229 /DNA_START=45 /DNA_END=801 /DNA_ORIENTATION=+
MRAESFGPSDMLPDRAHQPSARPKQGWPSLLDPSAHCFAGHKAHDDYNPGRFVPSLYASHGAVPDKEVPHHVCAAGGQVSSRAREIAKRDDVFAQGSGSMPIQALQEQRFNRLYSGDPVPFRIRMNDDGLEGDARVLDVQNSAVLQLPAGVAHDVNDDVIGERFGLSPRFRVRTEAHDPKLNHVRDAVLVDRDHVVLMRIGQLQPLSMLFHFRQKNRPAPKIHKSQLTSRSPQMALDQTLSQASTQHRGSL